MKLKTNIIVLGIMLLMLAGSLVACGGKTSSFEISLAVAKDICMDGTDLLSFVVPDGEGNDVHVFCENAFVNDANEIVLRDGGHLFTATPTPGLTKMNLKNIRGVDDIEEAWVDFGGGFGSNETTITRFSDIVWGNTNATGATYKDAYHKFRCNPSYFNLSSFKGEIIITDIRLYYDSSATETGFEQVYLDQDFYGVYPEGTLYEASRESFNGFDDLSFYLVMVPEKFGAKRYESNWVYGTLNYTVGDLYDSKGNVKSKDEPLAYGDRLGVFLCGKEYVLDLPILPKVAMQNLHEEMPYSSASAVGELNVLVVPFYFNDQKDTITQDRLVKIQKALGRVMDKSGNVTTYTLDDGKLTLSEYFDMASYGKLKITSYMTEWYAMSKGSFEDNKDDAMQEKYVDELQKWLQKNYSDMDGIFDADGNGYYDAVVLVCAGSEEDFGYFTYSISGAVQTTLAYGTERVEKGKTAIGYDIVINENLFYDEYDHNSGTLNADTLIHEFGHLFGLIDYYDTIYGEINAVGSYDMQSGNAGDWNPYSKFAVGWIDPIIVTAEEIEEKGSVEVCLKSYAVTGDTLLIPAKNTAVTGGRISPFEEYIAVELFTTDGVNAPYVGRYGLEGVTGVQIYHINGTAVARELTDEEHKKTYTLVHEAFVNSYNKAGRYQVELIQKPGINTFTPETDIYPILSDTDFFYAGDSFSMNRHKAFFYNGKMDNGTDFPYVITVKEIRGNEAVIIITMAK